MSYKRFIAEMSIAETALQKRHRRTVPFRGIMLRTPWRWGSPWLEPQVFPRTECRHGFCCLHSREWGLEVFQGASGENISPNLLRSPSWYGARRRELSEIAVDRELFRV